MSSANNEYSERYTDGKLEYRHVIIPKDRAKTIPKNRLLSEQEWRDMGIQQGRGWEHYGIHRPEPHILLFRRPLGTDGTTGVSDPDLERAEREKYQQEVIRKSRR